MKRLVTYGICLCLATIVASCDGNNGYRRSVEAEVLDTRAEADDVAYAPASEDYDDDITPDQVINYTLQDVRSSLPLEMMEGLIITDVRLQGSYILYTVECDDDTFSVYDLVDYSDEMRNNVFAYLSTMAYNDDDFAIFLAALVEKRMGICYRYVSDISGDYFDVKIKSSELAGLF